MLLRLFMSCALFPLRTLVFIIGFVDYYFEAAADWLVGARSATEYVRQGACRRCGRCCYLLGIEIPAWVSHRRWLVRLLRTWHSAGLNFEYQGETATILAYRCRYYRKGEGDRKGGCSIYPFRHRLCRSFPHQRLYGAIPLHDQCGFRFVRRDVLVRRRKRVEDGGSLFEDYLHND